MDIKINQGVLDALVNQKADEAERAFNQGMQAAKGQPLEQAVQTVAQSLKSSGVQANRDGIRDKLSELGWR